MNIFITDESPYLSAVALDDKRVNKMLLESCQMLSTAVNLHGGKAPYKTTHANHPSNVWARETRSNFQWLFSHASALSAQYSLRSGKNHACNAILNELMILDNVIPTGPLTPFANCSANSSKGISYKHLTDVTEAYKRYLIDRWNTDTKKPTWITMPSWVNIDKNEKFFYVGKEYDVLFGGKNESLSSITNTYINQSQS